MEPDIIKLKEIKPAVAGHIRTSLAMLKKDPFPGDRVIHDVRVLMKRSRAALKLAAPQMEQSTVKKDITTLREVGRRMCDWRESSVLRKELKKFSRELPSLFLQLSDNKRIAIILNEPVVEGSSGKSSEVEEINNLLRTTGYRIRFETMNTLDPHLLLKELENTYNRVVDIYLFCRNNPRPEKIHEFRKRTKDFLYQLYFFRPLNPSVIKVMEKRLDTLTQNLGRYNNLTQLVNALEYRYSNDSSLPALDELVLRIREKQDRYLSGVWPQAFKLFCPGQKLVNLLGFKLLII